MPSTMLPNVPRNTSNLSFRSAYLKSCIRDEDDVDDEEDVALVPFAISYHSQQKSLLLKIEPGEFYALDAAELE